MRVGALRKRFLVQEELPIPDGAGGYALTWTTRATAWAALTPLSGREVLAAGHLEGRVSHKVVMRWRKDMPLTPAMRLVLGERIFNIRSVVNAGEKDTQAILLAEEGAAS